MTIKVGINGFGRIGRMAFRAIAKDFNDIEVVGINDLLDADYLAYMLKYDSVHGRFDGDIAVEGNNLVVNGKTIRLTAERDPANLKWADIGADLIIECTGFFLTEESCQKHIDAGAKKVDNLIAFVDYNKKQIDGPTDEVMPLGDLRAKFEAFGFKVLEMNGNNMEDILQTIDKAKSMTRKGYPIIILMHTEMGMGVDYMMGTHKWHGVAPNDEQSPRQDDEYYGNHRQNGQPLFSAFLGAALHSF